MDFLKILLLYAVSNLSFRMLALSAAALSISTISYTAWRKKFLSSLPFLQALWNSLLFGLIEHTVLNAVVHIQRIIRLVTVSAALVGGKQKRRLAVNGNQLKKYKKCPTKHKPVEHRMV